MCRERTPSCFLQRKTPGRSQPFRAPSLHSQQTAEVGIPAYLITTNPPCPEGCKHIKTPFLLLSPCLAALGSVGPGQPGMKLFGFEAPDESAHTAGLQAASSQGRSVPDAARPSLGKAGLPHLLEPWHMSRHLALAALARGCKSAGAGSQRHDTVLPSCGPAPKALAQPIATSLRMPAPVEHHQQGEDLRISQLGWLGHNGVG